MFVSGEVTGDIAVGGMADFVGQNGFDLASFHTAEKTRAYRDERRVLVPSRGEGVRLRCIDDVDLGHRQLSTGSQLFNRTDIGRI